MEALYIKGAEDTPEVILDKEKNVFELTGKSLPEDVIEFYNPIFSWAEEYAKSPNDVTDVKIKIIYFNSASQRSLNEFLTILKKIELRNCTVNIHWYYDEDDEEMYDSGEEFADITELNFVYHPYQL
ncbi:MAG: DUF1987 domain-containing protein [Bacteroidales bacterium]|nr:DUF1987 domain-containing protein [Bacteroidales bacterium]